MVSNFELIILDLLSDISDNEDLRKFIGFVMEW